ncbi:unnamed protein product [Closterium sp. NIES-65]|nr:unnamed protein product [Closterium sp. NIES-65]
MGAALSSMLAAPESLLTFAVVAAVAWVVVKILLQPKFPRGEGSAGNRVQCYDPATLQYLGFSPALKASDGTAGAAAVGAQQLRAEEAVPEGADAIRGGKPGPHMQSRARCRWMLLSLLLNRSSLTAFLSSLTAFLSSLTAFLSSLTAFLSSLTAFLSSLTAFLSSLTAFLSSLTAFLSSLTAFLSSLTAFLSSLTAFLSSLTAFLSSLTAFLSSLTAFLSSLTAFLSSLTAFLSSLTAFLSSLTAFLSSPTAWSLIAAHLILSRVSARESGKVLVVLLPKSGKVLVDAGFGEILTTCEKIAWLLNEGERWLKPEYRSVGRTMLHKVARVEFEPAGVIGAIVPWNYPFHNVLNPVLSAVFAGNAAVIKVMPWNYPFLNVLNPVLSAVFAGNAAVIKYPFHNVPNPVLSAVFAGNAAVIKPRKRALKAVGGPPELVHVITGFGPTGSALVQSSVDRLIFVGSTAVGRKVLQPSASLLSSVSASLLSSVSASLLSSVSASLLSSVSASLLSSVSASLLSSVSASLLSSVSASLLSSVSASLLSSVSASLLSSVSASLLSSVSASLLSSVSASLLSSVSTSPQVLEASAVNLTPTVLELGGKDAFIVCDDADLKQVVPIALRAVFQCSGQNCIGAERFFVQAGIYDQFVGEVVSVAQQMRLGYPLADELEGDEQDGMNGGREKATAPASQQEGVGDGELGKVARGGQFYPPTVLVNVRPTMRILHEEVFGPIMCIVKFENDLEVVAAANDCPFGLGCSVFSGDRRRAAAIGAAVQCGMVAINDFGCTYMCQSLPFGGVKESGFGRFAGVEGLRGCCNEKAIVEDRFYSLIKTNIPPPLQILLSSRPTFLYLSSAIPASAGAHVLCPHPAGAALILISPLPCPSPCSNLPPPPAPAQYPLAPNAVPFQQALVRMFFAHTLLAQLSGLFHLLLELMRSPKRTNTPQRPSSAAHVAGAGATTSAARHNSGVGASGGERPHNE